MFRRAIWGKLPKCIFENLEFPNFQKSRGWFMSNITPNLKNHGIETKYLVTAVN